VVSFGVLGPLEVRRDGVLVALASGRQRALLAMLLLRAGEAVSAERLIDQLWGEDVPVAATNALQVHVSRLRRVLGADVLRTTPAGYLLHVETLDAAQFEAGVAEGRRALAAGRPNEAAETLRRALALWRGPALADFAYEPFSQADIARLEELRLTAREELMDAQLAQGECPVAELEGLVREHPLRERLRGQLMLALHRAGRQAEALATYRDGRRTMIAELGLEPSPALRRLEHDILRREVAPARPRVPLPRPLLSERPLVGREAELRAVRGALREAHVMLVSGGPGIGKTRLIAEVAGERHTAGATVLYGRADEGHPIPYGAIVAALRRRPLDDLEGFEPELATLASVLPELRGRFTAGQGPALCAALATVVAELARREPLLLVLDDLHWAERDTLLLVRHLVRSAPLTILAAARDSDPDPALIALIAELSTARQLTRVTLEGLDADATQALVGTNSPGLVDLVRRYTCGNPFLVEELLRHRREERLEVPESVEALLDLRLAGLDGERRDTLMAAAVIGAEFQIARLEAIVDDGDAVLAALDHALAAGLVEAADHDGERFRFTPPLLRDALVARLGAARRVRLQRRLAALHKRAA
jgi:DNA-binding SARP family transcriptional activator